MDCTVWNERHRTRLACRRPGAGARTYIHIYLLLLQVLSCTAPRCHCRWVDRFVRVHLYFLVQVLLLLLRAAAAPTSVLKRREAPPTVSSFSVSATINLSFASILLLLLLLEGICIFFFGRGAAAYNVSTEAERGTGYCFFLIRFCP